MWTSTAPEVGPKARNVLATAFFAAPVAAGLWVVAWVEAASVFGLAGSRAAWALFWAATAALTMAGLVAVRRVLRRDGKAQTPASLAIPGAILAATLLTALVAAPNNWDSMIYHNARVMQWWDHGSVAPWDTPNDRQLRMPPLASYYKLALLGLTGNDALFNLVQWAFFAFSILGAAVLAARLGPSDRAGPWAGLLVATTPMAVLQSTSTQNDLVVAGALLAAAFFLLRAFGPDGAPFGDLALGGAAVGVAFASKGTAYLLALPFLGAAAVAAVRRIARGQRGRTWAAGLAAAAILTVLPNAGFWWRNANVLGSPVGSAQEIVRPGAFFALGPVRAPGLAVSQIVRASFLQLGQLRLVGVGGDTLASATAFAHRLLGISVNEPGISGDVPFSNAEWPLLNHEDTSPSTVTFLLIAGATVLALVRKSRPGRRAVLGLFALGWGGWLLVALAVRWMPWNGRLQLPALILLAAPAGVVLAASLGHVPRAAVAALLVLQSLPALFLNSSRPLLGLSVSPGSPRLVRTLAPEGVQSIFATPRWEVYFRNRPELQAEVEAVLRDAARRCGPRGVVQLDLGTGEWEYALWVGAGRFAPGLRLHTGSPAPGGGVPCAVIRTACPDARAFCLDGPGR
jgi:hypothetical protein